MHREKKKGGGAERVGAFCCPCPFDHWWRTRTPDGLDEGVLRVCHQMANQCLSWKAKQCHIFCISNRSCTSQLTNDKCVIQIERKLTLNCRTFPSATRWCSCSGVMQYPILCKKKKKKEKRKEFSALVTHTANHTLTFNISQQLITQNFYL